MRAFERLAAAAIPNLAGVRLDPTRLAASLLLAVVVGLVSAAPALRALRVDPNSALKQASGRMGKGARAVRGALVVAQVAFTIVLRVAAGLLMRTVLRIVAAERGFEARQAVSLPLMLTESIRYDAKDRVAFVNGLVSQVRAVPGVTAAGVGSDLPPAGTQVTLTMRMVSETCNEMLGFSYAATFALLALVLAAVALGGAVAQSVLDRRHELAVRLALGSTAGAALRLMLRGGVALVALGVVIGTASALAAARMLRHLLHGVTPGDPVALAAAGLLAAGVSLVACYVPARRAAAISPAELLRNT